MKNKTINLRTEVHKFYIDEAINFLEDFKRKTPVKKNEVRIPVLLILPNKDSSGEI